MSTSRERVLLRGGSVYSPAHPRATAMLTVGDVVAWVGDDDGAAGHVDSANLVRDLDGRLVTPGFVDAHVHLSKTGFALQSVDLGSATSAADALDTLARWARTTDVAVLFAHGWDESGWPEARPFTGTELDRATGRRVAYVSRVDGHSAVVSSALVVRDEGITSVDGWRGDGVVERDAHHRARAVVETLWSDADRERALLLALRHAAGVGITSVHEVNAPHIAPYDDARLIDALRARHDLPEVVSYWGAMFGGDHVDESGCAGFAGDLCVDGALGSRTAALSAPYADADSVGHLYLDETQVRDHVVWCTERGVRAGFHVIGDRAVEVAMSGLRLAAEKVGVDTMVAARHRLEHVEMVQPIGVALLAQLGVVASVQPAFDTAWGGPGGLYAQRLGTGRSATMNPFGSMHRAGVTLAFGSDSPVTRMDPWAAVRAAVQHHDHDQRLSLATAFAAHTQGGHRARGADDAGLLVSGAAATYDVWDAVVTTAADPDDGWMALPVSLAVGPSPACLRSVESGVVVFDQADSS